MEPMSIVLKLIAKPAMKIARPVHNLLQIAYLVVAPCFYIKTVVFKVALKIRQWPTVRLKHVIPVLMSAPLVIKITEISALDV